MHIYAERLPPDRPKRARGQLAIRWNRLAIAVPLALIPFAFPLGLSLGSLRWGRSRAPRPPPDWHATPSSLQSNMPPLPEHASRPERLVERDRGPVLAASQG